MPSTTKSFGDYEVTVNYEYDRGERETGPSYACGGTPGTPPSLCISAVILPGGLVLDPELLSPTWVKETETSIMESIIEAEGEDGREWDDDRDDDDN